MKSTIVKVVKELDKNEIPYFLTGGIVLYLKGIIKETKDIDIFVDLKDFQKLKNIYSKQIIVVPENTKNYINLMMNAKEIEFIGASSGIDKYAYNALKTNDYDTIIINKQKVHLITFQNLITMYKAAYKRQGKEKHLKRIMLLEDWLSKNPK